MILYFVSPFANLPTIFVHIYLDEIIFALRRLTLLSPRAQQCVLAAILRVSRCYKS